MIRISVKLNFRPYIRHFVIIYLIITILYIINAYAVYNYVNI